MKKLLIPALFLVPVAATPLLARAPRTGTADPAAASAALLERGRYLVSTSGCTDCHVPWHVGENGPEPDFSRGLSGHPAGLEMPPAPEAEGPWLVSVAATNTAWAGPWGVSFTANLTPDVETGIGGWSEETFLAALRTGKHLGMGRPILPPMPWPVYGSMTDDDLRAIFAWLKSQPPVSNRVPQPLPPRS